MISVCCGGLRMIRFGLCFGEEGGGDNVPKKSKAGAWELRRGCT